MTDVQGIKRFSRSRRQAGYVVPDAPGWTPSTAVWTAGLAKYMRFVPSRTMTVVNIGFETTVAATANDEVSVAIFDPTGAVLASSGAVTGKANASVVGVQPVPLTTPYQVTGGEIYYAALSYGTIGGTAATLRTATFSSVGNATAFGTTVPLSELFSQSASAHPLPSSMASATATSSTGLMLWLKET